MYIYGALEQEEIRTLTVLPGTFGSEIHVELSHVKLDINNPPSYEALSYTWGSHDLSHVMFVDTDDGRKGLAVTENLYDAVQHLRNITSPRTLWVDAPCINQSDVEERSQQVARMADIYRSAAKVLIWLGPEADNSAKAIIALETLASNIYVDWEQFTISAASEEDAKSERLDHSKPAPFDHETWISISQLLSRSWFSRLWVWQEVSLAYNGAMIICGKSTMAFDDFRKAIMSLFQRPCWDGIPGVRENINSSYQLCRPRGAPTLQSILQDTTTAKCSDQRDRIYGVLNLVEKSERFGIEPDYTKTTAQVFRDMMLSSISRTRGLNLVTCCELQDERVEIPSWVPNWSSPRRCVKFISPGGACGDSVAQATYDHRDGCLRATGLHVGKILEAQQNLTIDTSSSRELYTSLKRVTSWLRNELGNDGFDRQMGAIWRTLRCNLFPDLWEPVKTTQPDFHKSLEQFRILVDPKVQADNSFLGSCGYVLNNFGNFLRNRSMNITGKGQLGLAPQASSPGDFIVVFLGCRSPMVLRPTGSSAYLVVGEAYVDGLMTGEAFLGPLLSNWQFVHRYDATTDCHMEAFIDRVRNKWQIEDPRLGPLPEGWVKEEHPNQHVHTVYRNVEQGFTTPFDPRMLPSALRARNVELTEFKLI